MNKLGLSKTIVFVLFFILPLLNTSIQAVNIIPKLYLTAKNVSSGTANWTITSAAINNANADYWKMLSGSSLESPTMDFSAYTSIQVTFSLASFGTIASHSDDIKVEYWNGTNWAQVGSNLHTTGTTSTPIVSLPFSYGSSKIKITAPNATTVGARVFSVEITGTASLPSPVVSSASPTGTVASAFSYFISATNTPTSYALVSGTLPAGLSLNTTTGLISGTPTAAGTPEVTVTATNATGTSDPATLSFTIAKANQTITFAALSEKSTLDADFSPATSVTSAINPITYTSSDEAVATIVSNQIHIVGAGTSTITALQAGNANYDAATNVQQTLTVKSPQTITFGALSAVTYGDATFDLTGVASSALTVSYTSSNTAVATVAGSTVTIIGAGSSNITASQAGNGTYLPATNVIQSLTVNAKALSITTATAANKPYDGTNAATISGTLTGIVNSDDVTLIGTGTFADLNVGTGIVVSSTSTLGGTKAANYTLTQPTELSANITIASQTITFGALPTKTIGDLSFALTATASSSLAVSYTSSNTAVAAVSGSTVSIVGAGSTTITASQSGNSNYNAAANVEQTLTVTTGPILAWQFGSPASSGDEVTYNATTNNSNLNVSTLSRGAGITATALARGFSSNAWALNGTKANAVSTNEYYQFKVNTKADYKVSLSTLDATLRRSGAGPNAYIWKYSVDGTNFTEIGNDVSFTSTVDGVVQAYIELSGISDLQNVTDATTITFRIYAWGSTNETSTFAIGRYGTGITTNCLRIGGSVAFASGLIIPTATDATSISGTTFNANWNAVTDATGYKVDVNLITTGSTLATDLFISEYIEGTSINKAIEIYNGTGSTIDLSNYSLKKQTNGEGSYGDEYVLSGTLLNGHVYVLANALANSEILLRSTATLPNTNPIVIFNGNDAMGLFKNSVKIDEVGIFNQVAVWGANVTLIRKNSILSPAATYSATDWDSNATDYILNLGSHSMSGFGTISTPIAGSPFSVSGQSTSSLTITGLAETSNYNYVVRATNGVDETANSNEIAVSTVLNAILTISPSSLNDFNYINGSGPSEEKNVTISAINLSSDISVTPPTNFEISTTTAPFVASSSITLSRDGSGILATTPIYVRLKAGLAIGTYLAENITFSTLGVSNQNVECNGAVNLALWKGTTNTDWNTSSNWVGNQVPAADAYIGFDGAAVNNCVLDANRSVYDINNSTSYKLQTNGFKLSIKGNVNLTNGAQIDASADGSTVEFAGATTQSIPIGMFAENNVYNLTINNASNVLLNGTLNLKNVLTATLGKLDAFTNSPTFAYAGATAQSIGNQFLNDIATNLTIDNAAGVTVNTDFTVNTLLTINASKQLIIPTEKQLNVVGTIANNAGVTGIYIKSSSTAANGSLIYHNAYETPVKATVEMYSVASKPGSSYKWQFFGIPLRSITAFPTFNGSYVRIMHEDDVPKHWEQLTNASVLTSFAGYEITQVSPKTIYFQGDLENKDYNSGVLAYTTDASFAGHHLIGNPYTAAINIADLTFGAEVQATVYMYNTGSKADWTASGSPDNFATSPGQYISVPKLQAGQSGILSQIPSMQAFLIRNSNTPSVVPGAHTLSIPYSAVASKNNTLQRAHSSINIEQSEKVACVIDVKGSRYADKLWIFTESNCTRNFDNGWDGLKFLSATPSPQLFAMEVDGDYQINTIDDINNTELGFQAGEDERYTLTFTQKNLSARYNALYLMDLQENITIDISKTGTEYSFMASATATPIKRFKIVTIPATATGISNILRTENLKVFSSQKTIFVDNKRNESGDLFIYDIVGKFIQKIPFISNGITTLPMNLTVGSYLVKAITKSEEKTTNLIMQ